MGRVLQQTSISTNIKERLDFSCALFAPDGDLVANAPFIPIHLGAMSFAVKYQMKLHGKTLKPGDVLMTNSPHAGGGGWGMPSADKEKGEREEGYKHGWEPRGSLAERAAKQAGF